MHVRPFLNRVVLLLIRLLNCWAPPFWNIFPTTRNIFFYFFFFQIETFSRGRDIKAGKQERRRSKENETHTHTHKPLWRSVDRYGTRDRNALIWVSLETFVMTIYSFEWGGVEEKDLRMNGTGLQSTDVCVSLSTCHWRRSRGSVRMAALAYSLRMPGTSGFKLVQLPIW